MIASPFASRLARSAYFVAFAGFVITAFIAPLNYASTRPESFLLLIRLCAFSSLIWLFGCLAAGRIPTLPGCLLLGCVLILCAAAAHIFWIDPPELPAFTTRHWRRVAGRWPHSLVPRDPVLLTAWAATALLSLAALVDLLRKPGRRVTLAIAIVTAGTLTALLGLVQNAHHAPGIWWEQGVRLPGAFFATFYHHTSAGAYLNTIWPLAVGLAVIAARAGRPICASAAGMAATLVFASHAGHVSRLPQVIGIAGAIALLALLLPWARLRDRRFLLAAGAIAALIIIAASALITQTGRLKVIRERWAGVEWSGMLPTPPGTRLPPPPEQAWNPLVRDDLFIAWKHQGYFMGDRGAAYSAALNAVADRPWFGFGPGNWMAAASLHSADPFVRTFFLYLQFTHQDVLQTLVEWGMVGSLGWALVLLAPWVSGLMRLLKNTASSPALEAAGLVAVTAVLAQGLIDFPAQIPALQFNLILITALLWSIAVAPRPTAVPLHATNLNH